MSAATSVMARRRLGTVPFYTQRTLIHVGLVAAAFVMVYPLLWMASSAFRPSEQLSLIHI